MSNLLRYLILILPVLFASCKSEELALGTSDYLVFGRYYGECLGENCVETFKLQSDKLLEDTLDIYPMAVSTLYYNGKYVTELSRQKFDSVKDIVSYFPAELLNVTDRVIGQPDAGDWGGLYIEYNFNGVHKCWFLDQMKSNVPAEYHDFIDKVNEKIDIIQK